MRSTLSRATFSAWIVMTAASLAGSAAAGAQVPSAKGRDADPAKPVPVALITGSDRGIGFALVQELESRGWRVLATCRDPEHADALKTFAVTHTHVSVDALDVSDNAAIEALSARYHNQPIDALINNAGLSGGLGNAGLGTLNPEEFSQVMRVNTYAPLKVSAAFLEQVAASKQKKVIAITSGLGSLLRVPQFKGTAYYSISKAALNMAMRIFQGEVRDRGVLVGIVAPPAVDTELARTYRATAEQAGRPVASQMRPPAEVARILVDYIETLGPERSGRFYTYTGEELPW